MNKIVPFAEACGVDYRAFSLNDPAAVDAALKQVPVVLNCAGPFIETALPLVQACLRTQTHYLDLAGEVPAFEALWPLDMDARAAGIMLLPGVGFGVVPTDCLAAQLKARLPSATQLELAFQALGGVSQGTALIVLGDLHRSGVARRNSRLVNVAAAEQRRMIDFGNGPALTLSNLWRGDYTTAYLSTGIPNIEIYSVVPPLVRRLLGARRYIGGLLGAPIIQRALQSQVRSQPAGPNDAERARGSSVVWGEVRDSSGRTITARLHGPDAYTLTALTALAIIERALAGATPIGFQTPAQAYGADFVLGIKGVTRIDVTNE